MKRWLPIVLCLIGCDSEKAPSSAPQSRVQAVLASSSSENAPAGDKAAGDKAANVPSPAASGAKPRAPLCADQLSAPAKPFTPSQKPAQRGAPGQPELPEQPKTQGRRWTWVNFWAAWCVPCKQELPLLLRWQEQLQSKLEFTFVSFDDDERQLLAFLQEQPEPGLKRSYWLPDGPVRTSWLQAMNLSSEPELPLQLLIDPSGKLRCRITGAVEESDLAALERIVSGE